MNKQLNAAMKPRNVVAKYTVCVKKDEIIVEHFLFKETERFAKSIFYFLRADSYANCHVVITERKCNTSALFIENLQHKANVRYIKNGTLCLEFWQFIKI